MNTILNAKKLKTAFRTLLFFSGLLFVTAALTFPKKLIAQEVVTYKELEKDEYAVEFRSSGNERFIAGPPEDRFPEHLEPQFIIQARSGYPSSLTGLHRDWKAYLNSDPNAKWISTNPEGNINASTAIYSKSFYLPEVEGYHARLDLNYSVDDQLGDWITQGLLVNGDEAPCLVYMGGFSQEYIATCKNIENFLISGINTLYLYDINFAGPAGIIFSGKITMTPIVEPTPTPTLQPTPTATQTPSKEEVVIQENENQKTPFIRTLLIIVSFLFIAILTTYIYNRYKLRQQQKEQIKKAQEQQK